MQGNMKNKQKTNKTTVWKFYYLCNSAIIAFVSNIKSNQLKVLLKPIVNPIKSHKLDQLY